MSISINDLAVIAGKFEQGTTEVEWRTSASRAYYSAYHLALASVDLCPDVNSNTRMGDHERLSERFKCHEKTSVKSISYILKEMKRIRHSADYDIGNQFLQLSATEQILTLKKLADKLCSFENQFRQSA